jgi:hypothetical protein
MVKQRLDKENVVSQTDDEVLKGFRCWTGQSKAAPHLSRRKTGLHGSQLCLHITFQDPKPRRGAIRHFIHVKTRCIRIVQDIQQNVDLTIHGIGQVGIQNGIREACLVV